MSKRVKNSDNINNLKKQRKISVEKNQTILDSYLTTNDTNLNKTSQEELKANFEISNEEIESDFIYSGQEIFDNFVASNKNERINVNINEIIDLSSDEETTNSNEATNSRMFAKVNLIIILIDYSNYKFHFLGKSLSLQFGQ